MFMSKKINFLMLNIFLLGSSQAFAVSQDECAIWLCMPAGFAVDGCSGAFHAMIHRVAHIPPKSPLPPFTSCVIDSGIPMPSGSNMSSKSGDAAYIPTHTVCHRWGEVHHTMVCTDQETIPSTIIKNTKCHASRYGSGQSSQPAYCTRSLFYAETYQDGIQLGDSYFFDTQGNTYTAEIIK